MNKTTPTLERILFTVQPSLLHLIDRARGGEERCAFIESLLWNSPVISSVAHDLDIERTDRPQRGRPRFG